MKLKDLIDFERLSFDRICDKIRNGNHFSLARYGDGEFNAILGKKGGNCDGHGYYPEMGKELAETLKSNPEYYIGLHQSAKIQDETLNWLNENNVNRDFVSNAVFHCATRDGLMNSLISALQEHGRVFIIAPEYVANQKMIMPKAFITIPGKETYKHLDLISKRLDNFNFEHSIVLIAASMTAPLIVDYLFEQYGKKGTFLDFGSTFDPYCGVKSRSFHQNLTQ